MTQIEQQERGVMTAMFAVLIVFFMLTFAALAEGGRKLNNLSRAEDIAAEVARSAAATLDLDEVADGVAKIDAEADGSGRAREQADLVVNAIDDAEIETFDVDDDSVFVRIRVSGTSFLPGFSLDAVGSHRALAYDPFG